MPSIELGTDGSGKELAEETCPSFGTKVYKKRGRPKKVPFDQQPFVLGKVKTKQELLNLLMRRNRDLETRTRCFSDSECSKRVTTKRKDQISDCSLDYLNLFVQRSDKCRNEGIRPLELQPPKFGTKVYKKRGRPKKTASSGKETDDSCEEIARTDAPSNSVTKVHKKRGRPKKVPGSGEENVEERTERFELQASTKVYKKRGRPRKVPSGPAEEVSLLRDTMSRQERIILKERARIAGRRSFSESECCCGSSTVLSSEKGLNYLDLSVAENRVKELQESIAKNITESSGVLEKSKNSHKTLLDEALMQRSERSSQFLSPSTKEELYLQYFAFDERRVKSGKKRGRPRKEKQTTEERTRRMSKGSLSEETQSDSDHRPKDQKKRGRPKKVLFNETSEQPRERVGLRPDLLSSRKSLPECVSARNCYSDSEVYVTRLDQVERARRYSLDSTVTFSEAYQQHWTGVRSDSEVVKQSKKRGRPRKDSSCSVGLNNSIASSSFGSKNSSKIVKKRGRPRKVSVCDNLVENDVHGGFDEAGFAVAGGSCKPPKKRGRPKKVSFSEALPESVARNAENIKHEVIANDVAADLEALRRTDHESDSKPKKKRGRPRKIDPSEETGAKQSEPIDSNLKSDAQAHSMPSKQRAQLQKSFNLADLKHPSSSLNQRFENDQSPSRALSDSEAMRSFTSSDSVSRVRYFSENEALIKPKKGRGRPRKDTSALINQSGSNDHIQLTNSVIDLGQNTPLKSAADAEPQAKIPRKRGRPSKAELLLREQAGSNVAESGPQSSTQQKKKPRKSMEASDQVTFYPLSVSLFSQSELLEELHACKNPDLQAQPGKVLVDRPQFSQVFNICLQ